jgi:nitrite reductase (NADH) small subunit
MTATVTRVPLCTLDELPVGLGRAFEVGGASLAVFRARTGEVYAVANACPHKGGPLADGMLIGAQVVCPLHTYRYHGETGECDQVGACAVEAFPAEVRDGTVFVAVPNS